MPNLYILAGCNGAGKTTAAYTLLPDVVNYVRSVSNLVNLYIPICDDFSVINNSGTQPEFIAQGGLNIGIDVFNERIWQTIKGYENA